MNDHLSAERLPHVHAMLSEYLDGQLDEATRQQVEAHLETCVDCRADYETLRQTVRVLRQLPTRPVPRGFAITASAPPRRRALFWLRVANSALAAVFIALLAARLVLPSLGQTTPARPNETSVRPALGLAPVSPNRTAPTVSEAASAASHTQAAPTAVAASAQPLVAAAARSSAATVPSIAAGPTEASAAAPTPIQVAAPVQRAPSVASSRREPAVAPLGTQATWPAWYDSLLGGVGALVLLMLGAVILIGRRR